MQERSEGLARDSARKVPISCACHRAARARAKPDDQRPALAFGHVHAMEQVGCMHDGLSVVERQPPACREVREEEAALVPAAAAQRNDGGHCGVPIDVLVVRPSLEWSVAADEARARRASTTSTTRANRRAVGVLSQRVQRRLKQLGKSMSILLDDAVFDHVELMRWMAVHRVGPLVEGQSGGHCVHALDAVLLQD